METSLHFSGGSHGDQVDIKIRTNGIVEVYGWNDGYPDRMSAGGFTLPMPKQLIQDYNQAAFIDWLEVAFWKGFEVYNPVDERRVKLFLQSHV